MRTRTETFTANVSKAFNIAGNRLEILESAYPVSVSLQDANGMEMTNGLAENIEAGSYMVPDGGFKRFVITSSTTQEVKFLVSYGESGTRSIAGTVQVVDGGKNRTLAGVTFSGAMGVSAIAAQYAYTELRNPAGSGVNLVVEQIIISSEAAQQIGIRISPAPLANLKASGAFSKKIGAAGGVSKAQYRTESSAAVIGTQNLAGGSIATNGQFVYRLSEPIVIEQGYGLLVASSLAGDLATTFEFYEDAVA